MPATFDPASGSLMPMHHIDVPAMMPGSHRARCSSVPNWSRVGPIWRSANQAAAIGAPALISASNTTNRSSDGRPPPAVLDRPGHAQPAPRAELLGERPVVAGDPGVLGDLGPLGRRQADLEGLVAQGLQLGGQGELHGGRR